jgi:hypothetical protein
MLVVLVTQEMSDLQVTQETQEQMDLLGQVALQEQADLQEMLATQDHQEMPEQVVTLGLVELAVLVALAELVALVLILDQTPQQLDLMAAVLVVSAEICLPKLNSHIQDLVNRGPQEKLAAPETLEALVTPVPRVTWVLLATQELVPHLEIQAVPRLTRGLARLVLRVRLGTLAHLVMLEQAPRLVARAELHLYHGQVPLVLLATREQLVTQDLPALVLHQEMLVEPRLTRGLVLRVPQEPLETLVQPVMLVSAQLQLMLQRVAALDHQAQLELLETLVRLVMPELVLAMVVMVL